jgi:hypothetical protein
MLVPVGTGRPFFAPAPADRPGPGGCRPDVPAAAEPGRKAKAGKSA